MLKSRIPIFLFVFSILSLCSSNLLADVFQYDIYINNADSPSLTFGTAAAVNQQPAPPYSGMFGIMDVYLANVTDPSPAQWFDRLSTDLQSTTSTNAWVLISKSNTTVDFSLISGTPENLKVAYYTKPTDSSTFTNKTISNFSTNNNGDTLDVDGDIANDDISDFSLTVKTGGIYVIYQSADDKTEITQSLPDDVVFIPATTITKNNNTDVNDNVDWKSKSFSGNNLSGNPVTIYLNAGNAGVAYDGEYTEGDAIPDNTEWSIKIECTDPNYTPNYSWGTEDENKNIELTVSFTLLDNAATSDDFTITMIPLASSATPVTTEVVADETTTIAWIIQKFGTLDFDGDGEITYNDVIYFYNFISLGSPTTEDETELDELLFYTDPTYSSTILAQKALNYFQNNLESLDFDQTNQGMHSNLGKPEINDVMYFYNYFFSGLPTVNDESNQTEFFRYTSLNNSGYSNAYKENIYMKALKTLQEYSQNN